MYEFLKGNGIALVWSFRDELASPSIIISDQVYIRFIGDRSISEQDFGKIVKDRTKEMIEYAKQIRETQKDNSDIRDILIAFNNHFTGFGPQSVNDFLKLINMSEIHWKRELERYENNSFGQSNDSRIQSSLTDFNK